MCAVARQLPTARAVGPDQLKVVGTAATEEEPATVRRPLRLVGRDNAGSQGTQPAAIDPDERNLSCRGAANHLVKATNCTISSRDEARCAAGEESRNDHHGHQRREPSTQTIGTNAALLPPASRDSGLALLTCTKTSSTLSRRQAHSSASSRGG